MRQNVISPLFRRSICRDTSPFRSLLPIPDLGCTGGPYEVATTYGVHKEVLCVGNEQSLRFAKDVLSEIIELFPSHYIHVGGDECPT